MGFGLEKNTCLAIIVTTSIMGCAPEENQQTRTQTVQVKQAKTQEAPKREQKPAQTATLATSNHVPSVEKDVEKEEWEDAEDTEDTESISRAARGDSTSRAESTDIIPPQKHTYDDPLLDQAPSTEAPSTEIINSSPPTSSHLTTDCLHTALSQVRIEMRGAITPALDLGTMDTPKVEPNLGGTCEELEVQLGAVRFSLQTNEIDPFASGYTYTAIPVGLMVQDIKHIGLEKKGVCYKNTKRCNAKFLISALGKSCKYSVQELSIFDISGLRLFINGALAYERTDLGVRIDGANTKWQDTALYGNSHWQEFAGAKTCPTGNLPATSPTTSTQSTQSTQPSLPPSSDEEGESSPSKEPL